jgi:hypothetical protein
MATNTHSDILSRYGKQRPTPPRPTHTHTCENNTGTGHCSVGVDLAEPLVHLMQVRAVRIKVRMIQ